MLVAHVIGDCPGCGGKDLYGNVLISDNSVLRGCKRCKFSSTVWLPPVRKKVLYLDQFFFSHAMRGEVRFQEAMKKIRLAASLQLLVAPFSSIHEDETHQWRGCDGHTKEDLLRFIKDVSRGHRFEPSYQIERMQVLDSFHRFNGGKSSDYVLAEREAIEGDLHSWESYLWIDAGHYLGNIEQARQSKVQTFSYLFNAFTDWRKSTATFDEDVRLEIADSGRGYLSTYFEMCRREIAGDLYAHLDSPIISMVVESMIGSLSSNLEPQEKLRIVLQFFTSEHFAETPYQWISARIFAVLKDMVKRGAYTNQEKANKRLRGFFYDVRHIATYAPYCDAFVMDTAMADLVHDRRIDLERRYGTLVFSLNNWDGLISWLDTLISGMTQEHREGLLDAYPHKFRSS